MILADEPTGALDSHTGREVLAMLQQLHAAGNTVVLITHDNSIAVQAQRIIRLEDGQCGLRRRRQRAGGRGSRPDAAGNGRMGRMSVLETFQLAVKNILEQQNAHLPHHAGHHHRRVRRSSSSWAWATACRAISRTAFPSMGTNVLTRHDHWAGAPPAPCSVEEMYEHRGRKHAECLKLACSPTATHGRHREGRHRHHERHQRHRRQ